MTLTDWMTKKGLSQEDLTRKGVLAKAVLSRFLNGEAMLSPANCARVVSHTKGKVTFEDLLAEHEERKKSAAVVSGD